MDFWVAVRVNGGLKQWTEEVINDYSKVVHDVVTLIHITAEKIQIEYITRLLHIKEFIRSR